MSKNNHVSDASEMAEETIAAEQTAEASVEDKEQDVQDVDLNDMNAKSGDANYAALTKQVEEQQQRVLRVQADFDNFRRRTMKEKEELAQYASMKLIEQMLPIVDNFERALMAAESNKDFDSFVKGIDMIFRLMGQTLEQEGLKPMMVVGEPFNPEFHQAVMQVESDEYEEGIVVEEIQKGYMMKDKVLRPAMVKVSG